MKKYVIKSKWDIGYLYMYSTDSFVLTPHINQAIRFDTPEDAQTRIYCHRYPDDYEVEEIEVTL